MNKQKRGLALCLRLTTWARALIFPSSASQFSGKAQGFPGKRTSLGTQTGEGIHLQCRRPGFDPWVGKIPWRREWQPTSNLAWIIPWTEEPGKQAIAQGVTKSQSQLSNYLFHFFSLSQESNFPQIATNSIPEAVFTSVFSLVWDVNCCWYPS